MKKGSKKRIQPAQRQRRKPGVEGRMKPQPVFDDPGYVGSGKLRRNVALISGGDSGIGRAVAVAFAKEGADVVIAYLDEHDDARQTKELVEGHGGACITFAGDLGSKSVCARLVKKTLSRFGRLDVLVNNAAEHYPREDLDEISAKQLEETFRTNVYSLFHLTQAALPHLESGARIVNTASVTAYRGSAHLLDYASTKGAVVSFTRSLAQQLVEKGIRVNAVAPGPVWTPLIVSSFPPEKVATFGSDVPMKRPGQPFEIAPCYVFLASSDSVYMTGQVLHPNGGEIVNG